MDREKFWDNIDVGRAGSESLADQAEKMVIVFTQMDAEEIIDFYHHFHDCMDGLLRWETWAVAHIILGDCNEEQFRHFRAFIISQNREAFDSFFHDPIGSPFDLELDKDEVSEAMTQAEQFINAPEVAFEKLTGGPIPENRLTREEPPGMRGESWEAEELAEHYPKLWDYYQNKNTNSQKTTQPETSKSGCAGIVLFIAFLGTSIIHFTKLLT